MSERPGHIVVPVDFSAPCATALQQAIALAARPSLVHVLFVLSPAILGGLGAASGPDDAGRRDEALEVLRRWVAEQGVKGVATEVRVGDPGSVIAQFASELDAYMIVIPSAGRSGLARWVIGSVAERVVRLANCTVLVQRTADVMPGDYVDGARDFTTRSVVVPFDFSQHSEHALVLAAGLVLGHRHLHVVHVLDRVDLSYPGLIWSSDDDDKRRRHALDRLESHLHRQGMDDATVHVVFGRPARQIVEVSESIDAELVVIGSRGTSDLSDVLLGSVTNQVIRGSHCNVLVLPEALRTTRS